MSSKAPPPSNTGRPPTTSVLRSALYYQNRIIIPEKKSQVQGDTSVPDGKSPKTPPQTLPPNVGKTNRQTTVPNGPRTYHGGAAAARPTSLGPVSNTTASASRNVTVNSNVALPERFSDLEQHGCGVGTSNSGDTMESHGIDIVVTDAEEEKKPSILKRFYKCLQDNRMKGNPNAEEILARSNPDDYKVLKKVLNITFITVGIALLVSVIIVIIYSKIGKLISKIISFCFTFLYARL